MTFSRVEAAVEAIAAGKFVILVDDEDRENEGDLCIAAEKITPETINFMALHARGLICLTLEEEQIKKLQIPMMVDHNTSQFETAFTVSIEARHGVTTGISAADRATTVLAAVADDAKPEDLVRPGHIFPLRAKKGGVLVRSGQTEGSVDLARMAGLKPAGVICEVMNEDGTMARRAELEVFSAKFDIPIVSVAELIEYRLRFDSLVERLVEREVEHDVWGPLKIMAYGTKLNDKEHLVVVKGDLNASKAPLVRVQAGYPLNRVLGDVLSPDRALLHEALERMNQEECGVLVCLDSDMGMTTLAECIARIGCEDKEEQPARFRELGVGAQILRDLGLKKIRVLANHQRRWIGLEAYGLSVEEMFSVQGGTSVKIAAAQEK